MSINRLKRVAGKKRRERRLNCGYCGESTYIEKISGRDACSHCGAGVDETFEEETNLITYGEHVAAQMENAQVVFAKAIGDTKSALITKKVTKGEATSYHRRRKQSGGLRADKVFAGIFLFFIVLAVFAPTMRNVMNMETPGDRVEPSAYAAMIEIELRIDLIDAETGTYNNYEAHLEILNDDDSVAYMFMLKNTALLQLVVQENKVYWVRIFPYQNSTYLANTFKAIADETQLITFPIY